MNGKVMYAVYPQRDNTNLGEPVTYISDTFRQVLHFWGAECG